MKGINMKKIAAFAAGAVMLGASVAVADVVYGSTPLVNQNGQPVVKVVVGAQAAASDGVAAGNIAAAIANEAYKSSTLTASVSGQATCAAAGSAAGSSSTGACSISDKKVTLDVTVPGSTAGAATIATYVNDFIDRTTMNRHKTAPEDNYNNTLSELSDTVSPFKNVSLSTGESQALYNIGSSFAPFADYAIQDPKSDLRLTEQQAVWVAGKNTFDTSQDQVTSKLDMVAYTVKFTGNDYGIPYCTSGTTGSDYYDCDTSAQARNHRIPVQFMGSQWVISDMTPSSTNTTLQNQVSAVVGGTVSIAKESSYGIINVGDKLDAGEVQIKLSDISVATGTGNDHPAILDILDSSGKVISQQQVSSTTGTYTYRTDSGKNIRIHVYQTSPGFTLNAKWAEIAVYSDELKLTSGSSKVDDNNANWKPIITWKNKEPPTTATGSVKLDSLRSIIIYADNTVSGNSKMTDGYKKGDSMSIIQSPSPFTLTYNGIDLTADDYSQLRFGTISRDSFVVSADTGAFSTNCTATITLNNTQLVQITSATPNAFTVNSESVDTMFWSMENNTAGTFAVYYKTSTATDGCYHKLNADANGLVPLIKYSVSGDSGTAAQGGALSLSATANATYSYLNGAVMGYTPNATIKLYEDGGAYNGQSSNADVWTFPVIPTSVPATGVANTYSFQPSSTSTNTQMNYTSIIGGPATGGMTGNLNLVDTPYVSERGSVFSQYGTDAVIINVATKVATVSWTLSSAGTTSSDTQEITLAEGDSQAVSGVTIKAKSITQSVGACTASVSGGAPSCTVDQTGVTAKIVDAGEYKDSVTTSEPYKVGKLVELDSDASASDSVISVGGPAVNTVTAAALQSSEGSAINFDTAHVVVKAVGKTIVVAGLTADDTLTAADQFIAAIKRQ